MVTLKVLATWLEDKLPKPQLRPDASGHTRRPVERVIVFGRIPNPTFDYYLAGRLQAADMPPYQVADIRGHELPTLKAEGAFVIICRYVSPSVLRWIERNAQCLSGVGLLLDDDIPAVVTGRDADIFYRLFLYYRALWPLRRLRRHLDVVWASTAHLAARLAEANALVLPPAPLKALWCNTARDTGAPELAGGKVLIAYHATSVHIEEHRFLRPIIEQVLSDRPQARFEVFADRRASTIWQGLGRVQIRTPLPWMEYLADADGRHIDIMLVPLAPSHVNDSRAPTKRIDIARYQAAAVFSEGAAYGLSDEYGELRLPYDATEWRKSILQLIDDVKLRRRLAGATREAVLQMTLSASTGLDALKV